MLSSLSSSSDALRWRPADDGVFVATLDGEYAGFVARTSQGYEAHSAVGLDLGCHTTRDLASSAVAASLDVAAGPAVPMHGRRSIRRPFLPPRGSARRGRSPRSSNG